MRHYSYACVTVQPGYYIFKIHSLISIKINYQNKLSDQHGFFNNESANGGNEINALYLLLLK